MHKTNAPAWTDKELPATAGPWSWLILPRVISAI